jgi:16S rRNA (cytidine1402-2'-O)-methyltransferase
MATLHVVGTPIGNLRDITDRAIDVLKTVDLIACEDTRHTAILLQRYDISTHMVSYHQHSSLQKIDWLVDQLAAGKDIALVTDAGTPGISDPGGVLVEKVHDHNDALPKHKAPIEIVSVPGPSSVMAALSISGMSADTFLFLGFLPKKKGRQSMLKGLATLTAEQGALGIDTVCFFESALRIQRTMEDIVTAFGESAERMEVCLCRELTKKFEETWRGSLVAAAEKTKQIQKGEFVVVLRLPRKETRKR